MLVTAASIGDQFVDILGRVVEIGIRVVIFLVIMALGWFVAKWIRRFIARALQRVGFDHAVERGGLQRMMGSNSASDLAARLVMYAFLLFVLQLAFGVFGPNQVSTLLSRVIAWLPALFVAVIIVVVTAAIAGWVKTAIAEALGGLSYGRTLGTVVQVMILVLGVMAALNQLGVGVTVTLPVLVTVLATLGGVIVVGVGGGLIRPMQHRWERILNRAETESTRAAEQLRAQRGRHAGDPNDRDANAPGGFDQPAYGGTRPGVVKMPATDETTVLTPTEGEQPRDR
jgi:hypothetical protein